MSENLGHAHPSAIPPKSTPFTGPGPRSSACKRTAFGTSVTRPVNGDGHWASTWVRSEFRILY